MSTTRNLLNQVTTGISDARDYTAIVMWLAGVCLQTRDEYDTEERMLFVPYGAFRPLVARKFQLSSSKVGLTVYLTKAGRLSPRAYGVEINNFVLSNKEWMELLNSAAMETELRSIIGAKTVTTPLEFRVSDDGEGSSLHFSSLDFHAVGTYHG